MQETYLFSLDLCDFFLLPKIMVANVHKWKKQRVALCWDPLYAAPPICVCISKYLAAMVTDTP